MCEPQLRVECHRLRVTISDRERVHWFAGRVHAALRILERTRCAGITVLDRGHALEELRRDGVTVLEDLFCVLRQLCAGDTFDATIRQVALDADAGRRRKRGE